MFCEKCGAKISNEANFCSACGQKTTQTIETESRSLTMAQDFKKAVSISAESTPFSYASTARRTIGGLIDMAIVFILSMLPTYLLLTVSAPPEGLTNEQYAKYLGFSFGLIISVAYEALLQSSRHQATLGQRFMKVIVTDLSGNRISLQKALGRTLMSCISSIIFKLGYVLQPFTSRKQTLHDMVAGTIVLDADKTSVENGKTQGGEAEGKIQEAGYDDKILDSRQGETDVVGKSSIWKQKDMRYVIGILSLVVVIGVVVIGYVSNIGLFGPIRYDVYVCEDPSENLRREAKERFGWDLGNGNNLDLRKSCEGGVPKYKAEFRIDKTSSSVWMILKPYEAVPTDAPSTPEKKLRKLSNCDVLDEQNWTCRGKVDVIDNVLIDPGKMQMLQGSVTQQPGYMANATSGNKSYSSYFVFKKK